MNSLSRQADELFTNEEREDIDYVLMHAAAYGDTTMEARAKKAQAAINRAATRPQPDTAAETKHDLLIFGQSFERVDEHGTKTRIDPIEVYNSPDAAAVKAAVEALGASLVAIPAELKHTRIKVHAALEALRAIGKLGDGK